MIATAKTIRPITLNILVLFLLVCTFLSLFKIHVFGSIIFFDFIAVSMIFFRLPAFMRIAKTIHFFGFIAVFTSAIFLALLFNGANEFAFLVRILLIIIDAIAISMLVRADRSNIAQITLFFALAFPIGQLVLVLNPKLDALFYFNSTKAWIAVAPILFVAWAQIAGYRKLKYLFIMLAMLLAFTLESRSLLVGSLLFLLHALGNSKLSMKLLWIPIILAVTFLILSKVDSLIGGQSYSNNIRAIMILEYFNFSWLQIVFGSGLDFWQDSLAWKYPVSSLEETFFSTANPHFFPAELLIRGGIPLFTAFFLFLSTIARRSEYGKVGFILVICTFFGTNTGIERLILSFGISLLIAGYKRGSRSEQLQYETPYTSELGRRIS